MRCTNVEAMGLRQGLLGSFVVLALLVPRGASAATHADVEPDHGPGGRELDRLRRITLTVNPLAVVMNRWGANVEVLPARHHGIVVSGYLQSFSLGRVRPFLPEDAQSYVRDDAPSLAGGELGYRFYTGRTGADGLFIGPSGVVVPLAYPRIAPRSAGVELQPYRAFGGALDVGLQSVTRIGLTVGGGLGVMVLTSKLPADPNRLAMPFSSNVLPRLLFTAGWSF